MFWWLLAGLALLSWGFTCALRQYAHTRWLDMPNERSSHVEPTPHGGGLAVVVTFFVGLLVLLFAELVSVQMVTGFAGAGARSEEHTSELQSRGQLVCRLLLEKKN